MAKFRKKPVVIDAVQWTGGNPNEVKVFTGIQADIVYGDGAATLSIATLEGTMTASRGDPSCSTQRVVWLERRRCVTINCQRMRYLC